MKRAGGYLSLHRCHASEIHFLNEASIRAHLGLGYRVIRTVTVISVLGWKVYRVVDEEGRAGYEARHAWQVRHI